MKEEAANYTRLLEEAIVEAKAAGLDAAAGDLEQSCFGRPFTTSNEMLGEHGIAISRFLLATRGTLPRTTTAKLKACQRVAGRSWPGWRNLLALLTSHRGRR